MNTAMGSARGKKFDPLNARIPDNPRYKHIRSTLDTGASMSKYMQKIDEIRTNYRYKKDEVFKRMKVTTFVQLVLQVAEVEVLEHDASRETSRYGNSARSTRSGGYGDAELERLDSANGHGDSPALTEGDFGAAPTSDTPRSTLHSVINGVGEMDLDGNEQGDMMTPFPSDPVECPYLLLDIRDPDEFQQCHMITALNYPAAMLSRTCNNETKELLSFKNKPGKIIVIYDEEERIANRAAATFVERGYDNLFLLSGGLKVAAQKFPEGLITGTLPPSCRPTQVTKKKAASSPQMATKKRFTVDDIEKINSHLQECLVPSDTGSRLSRSSTKASTSQSQASNMTARSSATNKGGESPWK